MPKPISIVGGGLAGLALGIGLRQRGVSVSIIEAGHYPRHRVCGEYISGSGWDVVRCLGLDSILESHRVERLRTVQFRSTHHESPVRYLPVAFGISRFQLDAALAAEFTRLGGELKTDQRAAVSKGEGRVRASGRRPQPTENGWRWFGLKAHARGLQLNADLELHLTPDSYVGLSRIEDGRYNVCGLFRSKAEPGQSRRAHFPVCSTEPFALLRGQEGSRLFERLRCGEFEAASFCSVAGLSLEARRNGDPDEVAIGDAYAMIPPATGNGMSMALESAGLAIEPLVRFSRGEISWPEARAQVQGSFRSAFDSRLCWARLLQTLMFSSVAHNGIGGWLMRSDRFWNWMFARTRS